MATEPITEHEANMSDQIPARSEPKADKGVRLSAKMRKALSLLAKERVSTQREAASKAGLSESYLSRMLGNDKVRGVLRSMMEQNIERAAIRASGRVCELVDAGSEHVSAKVALRVLESAVLIRPSGDTRGPVINNFGPVGYLIDLRGGRDQKRDLTALSH